MTGSWQRNVIGASAAVLLVAAGIMFAGTDGAGNEAIAGSLLRMGLVLAVLWLAWPEAFRPASLAVLATILALVFVITRFPKMIPFLIGAIIVLGILRPRLNMPPRRR